MKHVLFTSGDWTELLYRIDTEGGILLHDIIGTLPIYKIFSLFHFSISAAINGTIFFIQIIYAFLSLNTSLNISRICSNSKIEFSRISMTSQILAIIIFAFCPILGWKLGYGHLNMILGSFLFLGTTALIIAVHANRITYTLASSSIIAIIHCILSNGQQVCLYSIVFGLPILFGIFFNIKKNQSYSITIKTLLIPFFIILGSIGLSMPSLASMLNTAFGADSARSLNSESIIYQYLTANFTDWLSSIPWSKDLISQDRNSFFHHEINYPIGPIILLLFIVPWSKLYQLAIGTAVSLVLILFFSMNIEPIASFFPLLFPFLKSFRVPERAMMIISLLLPILSLSGIWSFYKPLQVFLKKETLVISIVLVISYLIITIFGFTFHFEILIWLFIFTCLKCNFLKFRNSNLKYDLILGILAIGSISAFKERLILPFIPIDQIVITMDKIGNKFIENNPEYSNPLNRVHLQTQINEFLANSPYMLNLSTINGYFPPQKRFSQLVSAIMGVPYYSTTNYFNFDSTQAYFMPLRILYNISRDLVYIDNKIQSTQPFQTLGPAWFSDSIISVDSFSELGHIFRNLNSTLNSQLLKSSWVVKIDPAISKISFPTINTLGCIDSRIVKIFASWETQDIQIQVDSKGRLCPLNISMNYSSNLKAISNSPVFQNLVTFPSNGALTGILVPQGLHNITISAIQYESYWLFVAPYVGILLLIFSFSLIKLSKNHYKEDGIHLAES